METEKVNALLVRNLDTGMLDLVREDSLKPIHHSFTDIEDMKEKVSKEGHRIETGRTFKHPYLGRCRSVIYTS